MRERILTKSPDDKVDGWSNLLPVTYITYRVLHRSSAARNDCCRLGHREQSASRAQLAMGTLPSCTRYLKNGCESDAVPAILSNPDGYPERVALRLRIAPQTRQSGCTQVDARDDDSNMWDITWASRAAGLIQLMSCPRNHSSADKMTRSAWLRARRRRATMVRAERVG